MDDGHPNIYFMKQLERDIKNPYWDTQAISRNQTFIYEYFLMSGSPAPNLLWHVAVGLGAEGAGDSDDHQDGGEAQDQVWPVLARTRGWVTVLILNRILIKFLFFRNKLVMWAV